MEYSDFIIICWFVFDESTNLRDQENVHFTNSTKEWYCFMS